MMNSLYNFILRNFLDKSRPRYRPSLWFVRPLESNSSTILVFVTGIGLILSNPTLYAQCDVTAEINTAYNFIVDSNIESPAGNNPTTAYITAKFCNKGTAPISGATAYIGTQATQTPGVYPSTTCPNIDCSNNTGTFALQHVADQSDAIRYMGDLAPNECKTQYWLVEYPSLDANGDAVWGASNDPNDDLDLQYDVWVNANCGGGTISAEDSQLAIMRNEITASANKIWPNGDNKVPDEFADAFAAQNILLGWNDPNNIPNTGEITHLQGVWYDMGVVNQGFDNDGDFQPDYNCWAQPVGNPDLFDPNCFRLVHSYGVLIIKAKTGDDIVHAFADQLYFENLPPNNGVVGLVFYVFMAADGACVGQLTPYQEAASGSDNEKFNADYGTTIDIASAEAEVTLNKTVDQGNIDFTPDPEPLVYTLEYANPITADTSVGAPEFSMPLVIQDRVPLGTTYIPGSASTAGNELPLGTGYAYDIIYSNDGLIWYNVEADVPGGPTAIQHIQWWLKDPLWPGETGQVQFSVNVPSTYSGAIVENVGALSMGGSAPFLTDNALTFLPGSNSIGDQVWIDNGTGGGTSSNGILDGGEVGLDGIDVTLYYDLNGNGELDAEDYLWGMQTSSGGGMYDFTGLPDGTFFVVPDNSGLAAAGCNGCGATTDTQYTVTLSGGGQDYNDADFGYMQPLSITKTLVTSDPGYEGQPVVFEIDVTNNLVDNECILENGSAIVASGGASAESAVATANETNALGAQDGTTALMGFDGNDTDPSTAGNMWMTIEVPYSRPPNCGTVTSVVGKWYFNITNTVVDGTVPYTDDQLILFAIVDDGNGTLEYATDPTEQIVLGPAELSGFVSPNVGLYSLQLSPTIIDAINLNRKIWLDITTGTDATIGSTQVGTTDDQAEIHIDAVGIQIFCDGNTVCDPAKVLNPVTVTDDYDANILDFVSSDLAISAITTDGGMETITWNNVGPILPGETQTISVTFEGLEPTDLLNGDLTTNTATVTDAYLGNGLPSNLGTDNATVTIENTGTICGTVWSDADGSGWTSATGQDVGEDGIPGVELTLIGCTQPFANNGSCGGTTITTTTVTDADGNYCFDGLIEGYEYTVAPTTSTLPGSSFTQTGDPDDDPVNGSGNGNTCGTGGANASCDDLWDGEGTEFQMGISSWGGESWDVTGINFGYVVPPSIYGNVFEDIDDSASPSSPDYPLEGITVYLCSGLATDPCNSGNAIASTSTDANGDYIFEDLATGDYTISTDFGTDTGYEGSNNVSDGGLDGIISVSVASGDISGSHDFGINQTGTSIVGDTIFYDWNGDGIQALTDEGIPSVGVNLYVDVDGNGVYDPATDYFWETTTTNGDGWYEFNNLPPYDYVVVVDEATLPSGILTQTADPDGAGTCLTCDGQSAVSADGVSSYLDEDFGYQPTGAGTIGDVVFYDANGDGTQAGLSEVGYEGVLVYLEADLNGDGNFVLVDSMYTDANGNYEFTNLPNSDYQVSIADPNDVYPDVFANSTETLFTATITNGTTNNTSACTQPDGVCDYACSDCPDSFDFGLAPLAAIGDMVYWDANGNGQMDWEEVGISGVTVQLCPPAGGDLGLGTDVCTTTLTSDGTDGNPIGYYQFTDLPPLDVAAGEYYLISIPTSPFGAVQTQDPDSDGLTCAQVGDPDPNINLGYDICDEDDEVYGITYGAQYGGGDFGYQPPGVIGDYVWNDLNGDGIQDPTEMGMPNVPVYLCSSSSPCTATSPDLVAQTITDFDGLYTFSQIPDGSYSISIDPDPAYAPSGSGSYDPNTGNTSIGANSTTVVISSGSVTEAGGIACTDCDLNLDFGLDLIPTGTNQVSGTICTDTNADGTCDADTPIDGINVSIYQTVVPTCDYTLVMQDAYADGWNGGYIVSDVNGVLTTHTFTTGSTTSHTISLATDDNLSLVVTNGNFPAEQYYELQDASGTVLHSDGSITCVGGGAGCVGATPTASGNVFSGTASCGLITVSLLETVTTDPSGNYTFTGLPDGEFTISVNDSQGPLDFSLVSTSDANGTDITGGGTPDFSNGLGGDTWAITLSGADASNVDFAYELPPLDYGDLPSSYDVLVAEDGPRHYQDPSLLLGATWDAETDGAATLLADGDAADEDGIAFNSPDLWVTGTNGGSIDVTVTGSGYLTGWIDFGKDGSFAGDMIFNYEVVGGDIQQKIAATETITFDVPTVDPLYNEPCGDVYARFRLFPEKQPFPEYSYLGLPSGNDPISQTGEVEDYLISFPACALLDYELISFTVTDKCPITIDWDIQVENITQYVLEASRDGINFEAIHTIEEYPDATGFRSYSYEDRTSKELYYYRLKIVEIDGRFSYSPVVSADGGKCFSKAEAYLVFPNPSATDWFLLDIMSRRDRAIKISLIDILGREAMVFETTILEGFNHKVPLDITDLPAGTYYIEIEGENWQLPAQRVIRVR